VFQKEFQKSWRQPERLVGFGAFLESQCVEAMLFWPFARK